MTISSKSRYIPPEAFENLAKKILDDQLPQRDEKAFEIDIYKIADGLGCKVEIVDFDNPDISACVSNKPNTDDEYVIQISREDNVKRRRFSAAHEIAHIILHGEDIQEGFIELRRKKAIDYDPEGLYKEIQANMLASALLMPQNLVKNAWCTTQSAEDIAGLFNVSREAAYNRLNNLGLIENE